MTRPSDSPVVVLLTPPGRGAVATLLVQGPGAVEAVEAVFEARGAQPLGSLPHDRLLFGHVGGRRGEEVVLRRRWPEAVELHCHGGLTPPAMLVRILAEQGCRPVAWRDWAPQSLGDPVQAAAMLALAEARTPKAAAVLLDQYHGALRRSMECIRRSLAAGETHRAGEELQRLLSRASLGRHLTRPWQVVLTGPPNAGKSTLLNALLGYQRAIVDPVAGTTRDVVTATTALEGWPVEFSDTAGVCTSDVAVQRAGMALAEEKLSRADLVVVVLDASQGPSPEGRGLLQARPEALVVYNKRDLVPEVAPRHFPGLLTSALKGQGIAELAQAIGKRLVPTAPKPGDAVPFTSPQVERIEEVKMLLRGGRIATAVALLAE